MHAQIAEEEGLFTMDDVIREITDKMIRRHPHVFGTAKAANSDEVLIAWEKIKAKEKEGKADVSAFLPAAMDEAKELIDSAKKRKGYL